MQRKIKFPILRTFSYSLRRAIICEISKVGELFVLTGDKIDKNCRSAGSERVFTIAGMNRKVHF